MIEANNDEVICPKCVTQFRAVPVNVQDMLRAQAEEIEELKDHLSFVERWANHHGQKDCITAESALSCIQHYPPIVAITKGYKDGKLPPEASSPFAERDTLAAQVKSIQQELNDATGKVKVLREALSEIDNWLVCAAIATPEDMAQSFLPMELMVATALQETAP